MITLRLSEKIKNTCEKNILPIVLTDWLLNGSVKDREDVYEIIINLEDVIIMLNGIYQQMSSEKINSKKVKKDLFESLRKILLNNSKYGNIETRNRKIIETRGWIIPIFSMCSSESNKNQCTEILFKFMNDKCDQLTYFWTLSSFIYETNIDKKEIKIKLESILANLNKKDRLYWLIKIWIINQSEKKKHKNIIIYNNRCFWFIRYME